MSGLHGTEGASIPLCCELLGVSKQAYYKKKRHEEHESLSQEVILGKVISIRNELPSLGGRKLYALLREYLPEELCPGRDRFFRLLREQGLLLRKRRTYRPLTTLSWHHFHKFHNLWLGRIPEGPNLVWAADITYVRMRNDKFLYLSLLTDVYSHKIVGWSLSESLEMQGPLSALKMALQELPPGHSLMHHSDRGVQYCCNAYINLLKENHIKISMTENGDPRENAVAERVNGILKEEWLNRADIVSLEQAREEVARVIALYNYKRPHLSIDYLTPALAHERQGPLKRQWKTYYKKKKDLEDIEKEPVTL